MKKREWTFSKFVDEFKSHEGRSGEFLYYQDALTDTVGSCIKHDFMHFNWRWVNDRKKRYNWGQLTSNLLLISQPFNRTPCHYDEQHNFFCQVSGWEGGREGGGREVGGRGERGRERQRKGGGREREQITAYTPKDTLFSSL